MGGRRRGPTATTADPAVEPAKADTPADGRWTVPGLTLAAYMGARPMTFGHSGGFRAWVAKLDDGKTVRRSLTEWDRIRRQYLRTPME